MFDNTALWWLYQQYPAYWIGLLALLGLLVGSFLNCVIYRLPLMLQRRWRHDAAELLTLPLPTDNLPRRYNLLVPRSACTHCATPIPAHHNIPLLSWLWLKGRCHQCQQPISGRYPLVELLTALLSGVIASLFPPDIATLGLLLLTWLLLALFFIDLDHLLLPDTLTLPLLWLGLLFNLHGLFVPLSDAVIGAVSGYLSLWLLYWGYRLATGKEGLGYGDFKLLAALGAWVGWQHLPGLLLLAAISGIVITLVSRMKKKLAADTPIPFGIYLAPAGWLTLLLLTTQQYNNTLSMPYFIQRLLALLFPY